MTVLKLIVWCYWACKAVTSLSPHEPGIEKGRTDFQHKEAFQLIFLYADVLNMVFLELVIHSCFPEVMDLALI